MNKLKTDLAKLRAYLGRDAIGIALLERAERSANEIRRESATRLENLEAVNAATQNQLAEISRLSHEIQKIKPECEQLKASYQQAVRDKQTAERQIKNLEERIEVLEGQWKPTGEETEYGTGLNSRSALRRCVLDLVKDMKHPPIPKEEMSMRAEAFELNELIKDYSVSELLKLGRMVAAMAMLTLPGVRIQCAQSVPQRRIESGGDVLPGSVHGAVVLSEADEHLTRKFIQWFRYGIDYRSHNIQQSKMVNDQAEPPALSGADARQFEAGAGVDVVYSEKRPLWARVKNLVNQGDKHEQS